MKFIGTLVLDFLRAFMNVHFAMNFNYKESFLKNRLKFLFRIIDISIPSQRLDLIVDKFLILELKAVEEILPIHEAQFLSYLKSTGLKIGLIINFKVKQLKSGIRRIIF